MEGVLPRYYRRPPHRPAEYERCKRLGFPCGSFSSGRPPPTCTCTTCVSFDSSPPARENKSLSGAEISSAVWDPVSVIGSGGATPCAVLRTSPGSWEVGPWGKRVGGRHHVKGGGRRDWPRKANQREGGGGGAAGGAGKGQGERWDLGSTGREHTDRVSSISKLKRGDALGNVMVGRRRGSAILLLPRPRRRELVPPSSPSAEGYEAGHFIPLSSRHVSSSSRHNFYTYP